MTIREANLQDARGIADLLGEIGEVRSVVSDNRAQMVLRVERELSLALASAQSAVLVAPSTDGQIAGYCAVHWVPFLFLSGPEAYVTELFVRPNTRSQGVGSALLQHAEAKARAHGCSRLALLNGREGESYRRQFYAKRGWIEREKMANFILPLKS